MSSVQSVLNPYNLHPATNKPCNVEDASRSSDESSQPITMPYYYGNYETDNSTITSYMSNAATTLTMASLMTATSLNSGNDDDDDEYEYEHEDEDFINFSTKYGENHKFKSQCRLRRRHDNIRDNQPNDFQNGMTSGGKHVFGKVGLGILAASSSKSRLANSLRKSQDATIKLESRDDSSSQNQQDEHTIDVEENEDKENATMKSIVSSTSTQISKNSNYSNASNSSENSNLNNFWATLAVHAASAAISAGSSETCARIAADSLLEDGQAMNKINASRRKRMVENQKGLHENVNSRNRSKKGALSLEPMKITSQTVRNAASKTSIAVLKSGDDEVHAVAAKVAEVILREGNHLLKDFAHDVNTKERKVTARKVANDEEREDMPTEEETNFHNFEYPKKNQASDVVRSSDKSISTSTSASSPSSACPTQASSTSNLFLRDTNRMLRKIKRANASNNNNNNSCVKKNSKQNPNNYDSIFDLASIVTDATSVKSKKDRYATDMDSLASPRNNRDLVASFATPPLLANHNSADVDTEEEAWGKQDVYQVEGTPSNVTENESSNSRCVRSSSRGQDGTNEYIQMPGAQPLHSESTAFVDNTQIELERKKANFDAAALALRQKLDDLAWELDHPSRSVGSGNDESWDRDTNGANEGGESWNNLEDYYRQSAKTQTEKQCPPDNTMMAVSSVATPIHHAYNVVDGQNKTIVSSASSHSASIHHHGYKSGQRDESLIVENNPIDCDDIASRCSSINGSIRPCLKKPSKAFPIVDVNDEPNVDDGTVVTSIGECRIHMVKEEGDNDDAPTSHNPTFGEDRYELSQEKCTPKDSDEDVAEAIEVELVNDDKSGPRTPSLRDKFKGLFFRNKKTVTFAAVDSIAGGNSVDSSPKDEPIPPECDGNSTIIKNREENIDELNSKKVDSTEEVSLVCGRKMKGGKQIRSFILKRISKWRRNQHSVPDPVDKDEGGVDANDDGHESKTDIPTCQYNEDNDENVHVNTNTQVKLREEQVVLESILKQGETNEEKTLVEEKDGGDIDGITVVSNESYTTSSETAPSLNKYATHSFHTQESNEDDGQIKKEWVETVLDRFILGDVSQDGASNTASSQFTSQSSNLGLTFL